MIELPLPSGVERHVIQTSGGPITALRARPDDTGAGTTSAAIMVSGFFGTKEDFRDILPLLARYGYDGWAYDYPGQLGVVAENDPGRYTVRYLAGELREIIRAVSNGKPVHVVGHCLGGFVAREAVLNEPGIACSLTLLACGPSMREPKHRAMLGGLKTMHKNGGTITLWPLVKRLLAEDDQIMREFWHAKLATMNPHFVTGAAQSMGDERDRSAELIAAGIPSLVVHGKRDKRLWSPGAYAEMARALNADLVVIEKAAHSPNMEQPGPTAAALLEFWAQAGPA
jgi:pimeloyl-ACP methyl ester carboxylesterase